jgi:hypothetical protein
MGNMVNAMKKRFRKVYSIELDKTLWQNAVTRFRDDGNVEILQGDSGTELRAVLRRISQPAAFWLDGHSSGDITAKGDKDTPVVQELLAIKEHMAANRIKDVIMIDDANLFTGENDYPSMREMQQLQAEHFPGYSFAVENNIIILKP